MIDVYIPVYNSIFCVEYQIKTLRCFLEDDFRLVIVDNNMGDHRETSDRIAEICEREGVELIVNEDEGCIKLNDLVAEGRLGASAKLGATLNMIWAIARDRDAEYFGFLDQDCFLFKPTSIIERLGKLPAYGKVVPTHPEPKHYKPDGQVLKWNLHVISNFYKVSWLKELASAGRPANFMPGYCAGLYFGEGTPATAAATTELDTGGMNWLTIWRSEDPTKYALVEDHYHYFEDTALLDPDGTKPTNTLFEVLDNRWVHMIHGAILGTSSEYLSPKASYMKGFLDSAMMAHDPSSRKPTAFRSVWDPRGKGN